MAADTVSLGDGEEYCYTIIVDGEIGEYCQLLYRDTVKPGLWTGPWTGLWTGLC